ncbi:MAG: hypothetical protein Unbinned4834contig1000_40 [Prokaryotic dsDNA virus sp.]|nr:MAG: hypothetical protein Unbinned4834contig1000_40 [Prokaryotic dsDNA virus sp.]|tara:strand:- start:26857 stop:27066 length:210 start_codon:yes stop_codon:yes gene_type:complete
MSSKKNNEIVDSETISQQTKQFLKKGGRIKKIPTGQGSQTPPPKGITINKSRIVDRMWSNASMALQKRR